MMPWQARVLLLLLMRKLDRAGVLDLAEFGGEEMASVLSVVVGLPVEVVEVGLPILLKRRTLTVRGQFLVMPNFMEAQETSQSDKLRKAEQRGRFREWTLATENGLVGDTVTDRDSLSHSVTSEGGNGTNGHARSQEVTPCCAVPSHAVPSGAVPTPTSAGHARIEQALRAHSELRAVDHRAAAAALAVRFEANKLAKGMRLEWVVDAIGECAADFAGQGLTSEALTKKLRAYCDNARPPRTDSVQGIRSTEPVETAHDRAAREQLKRDREEAAVVLEARRRHAAAVPEHSDASAGSSEAPAAAPHFTGQRGVS